MDGQIHSQILHAVDMRGGHLVDVRQGPAEIADGVFPIDLLDLVEKARYRVLDRGVDMQGNAGPRDLGRDTSPLVELVFAGIGRRCEHAVVKRPIHGLSVGGQVDPFVALKRPQPGNLGQEPVHLFRSPRGTRGQEAEEPEIEASLVGPPAEPVYVVGRTGSPDGRQARPVHILNHRQAAGLEDFRWRCRPGPADLVDSFRFDDSRGAAVGVAHDPRGVHVVEPDRLDRKAVQIAVFPGDLEEDGILGRGPVELFTRELAPVIGELIERPPAERENPLAGPQQRRAFADHPERFGPGLDAVEAQLELPDRTLFHDVGMVVDQTGHDRPAFQVDPRSVGSGQHHDRVSRAYRGHPVSTDGYGLGNREAVVYGDDLSVGQDEIRGLGLGVDRWTYARDAEPAGNGCQKPVPIAHGVHTMSRPIGASTKVFPRTLFVADGRSADTTVSGRPGYTGILGPSVQHDRIAWE